MRDLSLFYMRKTFLISLLIAITTLSSCKDESSGSSTSSSFSVSETEMVFDSDVREATVSITTNSSWTASSNVGWCQPIVSSGTGSKDLVLWVSPNITSEERSGTVTISVYNVKKTISVKQPAFTGDLDSYVYHLPVIFHVLYKDASDSLQNPSQARLARLIKTVNNEYYNSKANGTKARLGFIQNNEIDVVFEMAKYDDNGNELEEPGVIRHKISSDTINAYDFLSGEYSEYISYGQNIKRYINIYLFNFSDNALEGLTTTALVTTEHPLDSLRNADEYVNVSATKFSNMLYGVAINNTYLGEEDTETSIKLYDVNQILAHELGHYLGLLHTFSEVECEEDDACSDTPVSDLYEYWNQFSFFDGVWYRNGESTGNYIEKLTLRTDCNTLEQFEERNIMDYQFTWRDEFTDQQRARMRHVLYYGPFVPGPKLEDYTTVSLKNRSVWNSEFKPGIIKCPPHRFPVDN